MAPSSLHTLLPLSNLPDEVLLRIIRHLCTPPRRCRPPPPPPYPHPSQAFNLAITSHRFLNLFKTGCISIVDAVPDRNYLSPIPRCDSRFHSRDPAHLCTLAKLAGSSLRELYLPLYDCSMEDAHWRVMAFVARYCANLRVLGFVDSAVHTWITPERSQCEILARLLKGLEVLQIYAVRQVSKLRTLILVEGFMPKELVLHQVDRRLEEGIKELLSRRGGEVEKLVLSFEEGERTNLGRFWRRFLVGLVDVVARFMPRLRHLEITELPRLNVLTGLRGPGVLGQKESRKEFERVRAEVERAKRKRGALLKSLVIEKVVEEVWDVVSVLGRFCGRGTRVEVCLSEVLLVSPAAATGGGAGGEQEADYFRATKLHSSSWMISDLAGAYFRSVEHIHVGLDEDCSKAARPWYDRMMNENGNRSVNPDMQSFRFLCEKSGGRVQSVYARVPIESMEKANVVLRMLSSGFAFARNVSRLELSGDVLKYVVLDHSLLYSVIGQLKNLRNMYVREPTCEEYHKAQMEGLPVLIRALWMSCHRLESFEFEFSSFGGMACCSVESLRLGLEALREFDLKLPGVVTHNLGELLEIAIKHCSAEGGGEGGEGGVSLGSLG